MFRLWRLRLFRRCGMTGCVLLLLICITAYNIPGDQSPRRTTHAPSVHPTPGPRPSTKDTFAAHFQAGFHFQRNNSRWHVGQSQDKVLHLRIPDDWPQFFQPRSQQLYSLEFSYRHDARQICSSPVDLLVLVPSALKNQRQRQAVRQTWGSVVTSGTWPGESQWLGQRVGLVFLLGEDLSQQLKSGDVDEESKKYGDVVQWEGLQDSYFNLTMKVLLGLRWASDFCRGATQVMKTDDDTFVHVPRILQRIYTPDTTNTVWGPFFKTSPCDRTGKFAVSKEAYPFDFYPSHVKGNMYILSGDVVDRLVMLAPYLPYSNMEDVHITGTLARALAIRHQPLTRKEFSVEAASPDLCVFMDDIKLGCQMVSPNLALRIWGTFSNDSLCHHKRHHGQL